MGIKNWGGTKNFTVNLENLDGCQVVISNPVNSTTFVYSVNYLCLTWLNYIFFHFSNSLSSITSMVRALQFGRHDTSWLHCIMITVDQKVYEMKDAGFQTRKMLVVLKPWRSFWSYSKANVFFQWDNNIKTTTETRTHVQKQNLKIGNLEPSYVWITLTRALVSQSDAHPNKKPQFKKEKQNAKPNITRGTRRENAERRIESRPSRMNKMENYCIHAH